MATSSLYGSVSESTGLYGIGAASGGTYFEWFIFYDSATAPATPTGGSWSFSTNTGTAPTGWLNAPPASPVNQVWVSIAVVDSRNTGSLVWSIPGLMTGSGLPILTGTGNPSAGTGLNGQLYIRTDAAPQSMWLKEAGTWIQLTGGSVYALAGPNNNITSLSGLTGGISTADYVQFDTGITPTTAVGKLQWDPIWGGPQIGMTGGNVNLQIGQENVVYVYNNSGSQINEGQIVKVVGSQGQRLTVGLAQANTDGGSVTVLGMATENIANGASGFVTTQGLVNNVNTNGLADGTVLWLSPTTAGAYTSTKPVAPNHLVLVGYVVKGGSTGGGSIFIHTQNGYELNELHDVLITSVANRNLLQYNSGIPAWVNIAGPNGDVVGTIDTQTLTNKTISGSSNTLTNIPNSALVYDSVNVNGVDLTLGNVQLVGADWILPSYAGNAGKVLYVNTSASDVEWRAIAGTGTVTSIDVSGGTTGLTTTGGPVTAAGTITLGGTLAVSNGGTGATTATNARSNLGLGSIATQNANNVSITGGSISGITDLAIVDGGTGASTAADARTNLGLGSSAVLNAGVAGGVATLDGGGTVPTSQLPAAVLGSVKYQGTWNASTNSPTLTSSVGTQGYYYVVSVAGSTNLDGITDWKVGDWAIYSGTAWQKIDNTDAVSSVNGYTGTVSLTYSDVEAPSTTGTNATGTWGIDITGNAATATSATTATDVSGGTASVTTLTTSSTVTLNGGTANGVAYLNASKVLTTGSALTFDGTKFGINTPSPLAALHVNGDVIVGLNSASTNVLSLTNGGLDTVAATVPMKFSINGSEQMRLTSTGLGIGTSSPAYKLDVASSSGQSHVRINSAAANDANLLFAVGSTNKLAQYYEASSGALKFYDYTAAATRLTLDSSGNLGLGVTPSAWSVGKAYEMRNAGNGLFTNGAGEMLVTANAYYNGGWLYGTSNVRAARYVCGNTNGTHLWYVSTDASQTAGSTITWTQAMTLTANGNNLIGKTTDSNIRLDVQADASNTAALVLRNSSGTQVTRIGAEGAGASIDTGIYSGGYTRFYVNGNTSTPVGMFDSSGNLLVGGLTSIPTQGATGTGIYGTGTGRINIANNSASATVMAFYSSTQNTGTITTTATNTTYGTSSDYRLKEFVAKVTGSGERIDALNPVEFDWKTSGQRARGFFAHEFQTVYADSVTGEKDAMDEEGKPVYQAMQAGSAEVIADLVAEIQSLRKRLAALESKA